MGIVLDSSIIIAAERKGQSVRQILEHVLATQGDTVVGISVVTAAELFHGVYRAATKMQQQQRLAFVEELCRDVPVYPMTLDIARLVGRIEGQQVIQGIQSAFEDLVIGCTALHLGYDLATLNTKHFQKIPGLTLVHT